tara:strand:- start:67 stop:426 length:360 start_codon:yes stop_codon:yes gene_type:complete
MSTAQKVNKNRAWQPRVVRRRSKNKNSATAWAANRRKYLYRVSMWHVKSYILKNVGPWSPPSKAQELLTDVRRRETKKRLQRAQTTRALSKRDQKQFRRRFKNSGRANRHIFTNKDMRM